MATEFKEGQSVIVSEGDREVKGYVDAVQIVGDKVTSVIVRVIHPGHEHHGKNKGFPPGQVKINSSYKKPVEDDE
jgi:hypothetical protein